MFGSQQFQCFATSIQIAGQVSNLALWSIELRSLPAYFPEEFSHAFGQKH